MISSRNFYKILNNMFNTSMWHDGRMNNLEYVWIPFSFVLYCDLWIFLRAPTKNEIQRQNYHSSQAIIMVHITYSHGPNGIEDRRVIFKEYHFYISDNSCYDLHYVLHCFRMFYDHLKERYIYMDQHWISLYGCVGQ